MCVWVGGQVGRCVCVWVGVSVRVGVVVRQLEVDKNSSQDMSFLHYPFILNTGYTFNTGYQLINKSSA